MPHPDVLIIGGGIVGLTTAYLLAKSGVRVTVADRGELGKEASWAGAGIIPPPTSRLDVSPLDRLRTFSVERFQSLSDELKTSTGIDNEYHVCGGIECLPINDQADIDLWQNAGVTFEPLSNNPPWLRQPPGTTSYALPYAQVRNPRHLTALIAACQQLGVTLLPHHPILPESLPVAGKYLIAAGAWADEFLSKFGLPPLVHPVRGQIVLFKPERHVMSGVLIVGHRYLVQRQDGRVLVGSTEEPEAGFTKANTPEAVRELIQFATEVVPGLKDAEVEMTWSGLRPGSRDGLPYLGKISSTKNIYAAVGHYRAGVQLSPGTSEVMKRLLRGEELPFSLDAFRLDRPPAKPERPTFRA